MRKVYFQEYSEANFNAGTKARNDCDRILSESGYEPYYLKYSRKPRKRFFRKISMAAMLARCSHCFLQYPYYTVPLAVDDYRLIFSCFRGRLDCLVHDVNSLRSGGGSGPGPDFRALAARADRLIVHTPSMKEALVRTGGIPPEKVEVLYLFDYLTDDGITPADPDGRTVIFAGNLDKSTFIRDLGRLPDGIRFNLYGAPSVNIHKTPGCIYKGKFRPEEVSFLEGDWGLVWDGDSIDTCSGPLGEYMRLNSPHKTSLYLAAGKPLIVWRESALRDFVMENRLGIDVGSLGEVGSRLDSLTAEEKREIATAVACFSRKVRSGAFLKQFLG